MVSGDQLLLNELCKINFELKEVKGLLRQSNIEKNLIYIQEYNIVKKYGKSGYTNDQLQVSGAESIISFDIANFSNLIKLVQFSITQRVSGTALYTVEIWEKSVYNASSRSDLLYRLWTRDYTLDEDSDIIDPELLYIDKDTTSKLHVRIVNGGGVSGGQVSDFDISIKGFKL